MADGDCSLSHNVACVPWNQKVGLRVQERTAVKSYGGSPRFVKPRALEKLLFRLSLTLMWVICIRQATVPYGQFVRLEVSSSFGDCGDSTVSPQTANKVWIRLVLPVSGPSGCRCCDCCFASAA